MKDSQVIPKNSAFTISNEALRFLESNKEFCSKIDRWICRSIEKGGSNWDDLLKDLPGVYPLEVIASLHRLQKIDLIDFECRDEIHSISENVDSSLEHPLDFEWRFSRKAVDSILGELSNLHDRDTVLCFGCPSVFKFGESKTSRFNVKLIDKRASSFLSERLTKNQLIEADLSKDIPLNLIGNAAVLDPPWYIPLIKSFLWHAVKNLQLGANVYLSVAPQGTRPSAESELEEIQNYAYSLGLADCKVKRGILGYQTPFFEYSAMLAAGITHPPLNWRCGDLVSWKKTVETAPVFPELSVREPKSIDLEFCVDASRIRVTNLSPDAPAEYHHFPGGVLPTVSTRFGEREFANIVTTGNRFIYLPKLDINKVDEDSLLSSHFYIPELGSTLRQLIEAELEDIKAYKSKLYENN